MINMQKKLIGKLLRANATRVVAGCNASDLINPSLGGLTRIPIEDDLDIYGLICDISILDDGLVRQIVSGINIPAEYTADNRFNRNLPVEINILTIGYQKNDQIFHLLPPRPPLSLDAIYLCDDNELIRFTSGGHFSYFRHVLRAMDLPIGEILAAHMQFAQSAYARAGNENWFIEASKELITLLRDDYPTLMNVLGALTDIKE